MESSSTQAPDESQLSIPPGYSIREMPDGRNYIVPNFMIDATNLAVQSESMKRSLKVGEAPGGVSAFNSSLHGKSLASAGVYVPVVVPKFCVFQLHPKALSPTDVPFTSSRFQWKTSHGS
jgi:hypothetical protein